MEISTHNLGDEEIMLKDVYLGESRECVSYGYYDPHDEVIYKGFIDGDSHSVKVVDNYTRRFMMERNLPPIDGLASEHHVKSEIRLLLAGLAMDVRRKLPIDGQIEIF